MIRKIFQALLLYLLINLVRSFISYAVSYPPVPIQLLPFANIISKSSISYPYYENAYEPGGFNATWTDIEQAFGSEQSTSEPVVEQDMEQFSSWYLNKF